VATASDDATVKLWDVDHQCEIATLSGDLMGFISVVFSPDGTRLVGGGANGTIKVWDICALPPQDVLTLIAPHRVSGLVFTDQGNTLCSMSDTNLMCWEATPWPAIQKASWPSMAR
jgi:WD40 repeat protein